MATSTAGRAPSYWCRVPLRRGSRVRILRASDDLQEGQRDRQAREAGSFSERLAVFLFCIVFQERMVQVGYAAYEVPLSRPFSLRPPQNLTCKLSTPPAHHLPLLSLLPLPIARPP